MNDKISRSPEIVQFGDADISIRSIIGSLFPRGTHLKLVPSDKGNKFTVEHEFSSDQVRLNPSPEYWRDAPPLPPDVFALAAILLDLSGASHQVADRPPPEWPHVIDTNAGKKNNGGLKEVIAQTARAWGNSPKNGKFKTPPYIQVLWADLLSHSDSSVFTFLADDEPPPKWWAIALELLVVADEAASKIGFQRADTNLRVVFETLLWPVPDNITENAAITNEISPKTTTRTHGGQYTIATIPPDVACVMPKSRTSQVGCTLRSLSHNLALLPPRGKARAYWNVPPSAMQLKKDSEPLNLLLVPHPYQLPPASLEMGEVREFDEARKDHPWGWFKVAQAWPPINNETKKEDSDQIIGLVRTLATESRKMGGSVNGIVFPEASLTYDTFDILLMNIAAAEPGDPLANVEVVVSGLRTDFSGGRGNFAGVCVFGRLGKEVLTMTAIQQKHHRWKIDQRQVKMYGLGSHMTSGATWWESIPLSSRCLHLSMFRAGSILATLVCEDLARLEPIYEIIRAVGPPIVIALLMDGPQVSGRWPGRYAMVLAEDPGSSVLTLTSLGPVLRAEQRSEKKSKSIALWRDELGDTREIALDSGASAVLLSLSRHADFEYTADGRGSSIHRWIYADHVSVRLQTEDAINYPWAISP